MPEALPSILPSEVIANLQAFAGENDIVGLEVWDIIQKSCPDARFLGDGETPDYGTGEMVAEVIGNNLYLIDLEIYDLEDDDGKLIMSSPAFISYLERLKGEYDIANYVWKDGRIWAVEEQCWSEDL